MVIKISNFLHVFRSISNTEKNPFKKAKKFPVPLFNVPQRQQQNDEGREKLFENFPFQFIDGNR